MNSWIKGAIALALYDFWLLSFPLGVNLAHENGNLYFLSFMNSHVFTLIILPFVFKRTIPEYVLKISTLLLILLTISFPILENLGILILIISGILSTATLIRTMGILNYHNFNSLAIGLGLALGNFLVFLVSYLPFTQLLKFTIISLSLISVIVFPSKIVENPNLRNLKIYLPFIYVFYLIGGIFHGFLSEEYKNVALVNGLDLFFYIIFALLSVYIIRKDKDSIMALGILLSMLSFSLFKGENSSLINLSMFSMQSSFALMDFFLIFLIISSGSDLRAISYVIGVMGFALICGNILTLYFSNTVKYLIAIGNIILTIATLMFYFLGKKILKSEPKIESKKDSFIIPKEIKSESPIQDSGIQKIDVLLSTSPKKFSPKEIEVLKLLIQDKTYKEIAQELNISESSVKTYVRRISEKLNVHGKEGILEIIRRL